MKFIIKINFFYYKFDKSYTLCEKLKYIGEWSNNLHNTKYLEDYFMNNLFYVNSIMYDIMVNL